MPSRQELCRAIRLIQRRRAQALYRTSRAPVLATNTGQAFSNPVLFNNILWRQQVVFDMTTQAQECLRVQDHILIVLYSDIWDLQVSGVVGSMVSEDRLLTDRTGYDLITNTTGDPRFCVVISGQYSDSPCY